MKIKSGQILGYYSYFSNKDNPYFASMMPIFDGTSNGTVEIWKMKSNQVSGKPIFKSNSFKYSKNGIRKAIQYFKGV